MNKKHLRKHAGVFLYAQNILNGIKSYMEKNGLKTHKIVELSFPEYNTFGKIKRLFKKRLFNKPLDNPNLCYIGTLKQ